MLTEGSQCGTAAGSQLFAGICECEVLPSDWLVDHEGISQVVEIRENVGSSSVVGCLLLDGSPVSHFFKLNLPSPLARFLTRT
jgi:hypothetical protein